MNRIAQAFDQQGKKALIAFITGGDPNIEMTKQLIIAMAHAGVDLIEIGIPFSDPAAEGPVIERANIRGLASGTTVNHLFDMVKEVRKTVQIPILLMTYANLIFAYGKEKFMQNCQIAGIDGLIVPDLPLEEMGEFKATCGEYGVQQISMLAPTSTGRIEKIVEQAEGFLYCVSSLGVTGMRSSLETTIGDLIEKVDGKLPCAIGFGVSTPEQAKAMAQLADGVIIGSAIVALIEAHGEASVAPVTAFIQAVRKELD
ncbi:MAG: tryptophan synthase subunit alpha [Defluviitaleaceae bacterium]|nr:tryptophan synthase subunit alpha [Defluviitaleaceae bacterium]